MPSSEEKSNYDRRHYDRRRLTAGVITHRSHASPSVTSVDVLAGLRHVSIPVERGVLTSRHFEVRIRFLPVPSRLFVRVVLQPGLNVFVAAGAHEVHVRCAETQVVLRHFFVQRLRP